MPSEPAPMPVEKALAILREAAELLGAEHLRAYEVVARVVERAGRRTTGRMEAVAATSFGAQHFTKATAIAEQARRNLEEVVEHVQTGLAEVARGARTIREEEVAVSDDDPRSER